MFKAIIKQMDKVISGIAITIVIAFCSYMIFFKDQKGAFLDKAFLFITDSVGIAYIGIAIFVIFVGAYLCLSGAGNIILGDKNTTEKEFSTFSWAAMLFSAGVGPNVIFWGTTEWMFYYLTPPFGITPQSPAAAEWAMTYSLFHWGPVPWGFYGLMAVPIAYRYFVHHETSLKLSKSIYILDKPSIFNKCLTTLIDTFTIIALIGGGTTSLGFIVPLISAGISELFSIPDTVYLKIFSLLCIFVTFSTSAFLGLKKGIKILSDISIYLLLLILVALFLYGDSLFFLKLGTNSVGMLFDNFFHMLFYTDPILDRKFVEHWTIFYWAFWLVYTPFMGLFVARISKGRTIKEMFLGSVIFGTLGSGMFFVLFGGTAMHMQLFENVDLYSILNQYGQSAVVMKVIHSLPMTAFFLVFFVLSAIILQATTYDSASIILTATSQKDKYGDTENKATSFLRVFWAIMISLPSLTLIVTNASIPQIQSISLMTGIPIIGIFVLIVYSFYKEVIKPQNIVKHRYQMPKLSSLRKRSLIERKKKKDKEARKRNDAFYKKEK